MGWPFLIGSGRRRDYSTLMAPDFLVAELEYGILDEKVSPIPVGAPARVIEVTARGGRRLAIAYATHLVTADDVAGPQATPGAEVAGPRDEHSRPLRLSFGFVCPDASIDGPAEADLDVARVAALDVYRRFLDNEEGFGVVPSSAFPLRSGITVVAAPARPAPVPGVPSTAGGFAAPSRPARWLWGLAAVAGVALVVLVLALVNSGDTERPRCDTTSSADRTGVPGASADRTPVPGASASCSPLGG